MICEQNEAMKEQRAAQIRVLSKGEYPRSIQESLELLMFKKGMTRKDAIAELESIFRCKIPEEILERL